MYIKADTRTSRGQEGVRVSRSVPKGGWRKNIDLYNNYYTPYLVDYTC